MKEKTIGRGRDRMTVAKVRYQYSGERKLVSLYNVSPPIHSEGAHTCVSLTAAETRQLVEHLQKALEEGVEK